MTETITTFQPSFMQKLLGRNYKWWYLLVFCFKTSTTYLINDVLWLMSRVLTLLLVILVFVLSNRSDSESILTYLISGNILMSLVSVLHSWSICNEIFDGKITSKLIVPTNLVGRWFCETVPGVLKNSIIIFTIFLPLSLFFPNYISINFNFFQILPLMLFAYLIRFFLEIMVGLSCFWLTQAYGVIDGHLALIPLLSGSLIPLYLFGDNFKFLIFTPFAFTFYHPMQIYLGKYSPLETLYVFLGGIAWCVVLYFLAKWVFKMGLKRNESVGL